MKISTTRSKFNHNSFEENEKNVEKWWYVYLFKFNFYPNGNRINQGNYSHETIKIRKIVVSHAEQSRILNSVEPQTTVCTTDAIPPTRAVNLFAVPNVNIRIDRVYSLVKILKSETSKGINESFSLLQKWTEQSL